MGNCILHIIETFRLQRCFDDEHEEYVKTKKKEILDEKIAGVQRKRGMLCLTCESLVLACQNSNKLFTFPFLSRFKSDKRSCWYKMK